MEFSIFLSVIIVAVVIGAFLYLKKRSTSTEKKLDPNKLYTFTYVFVFDSKAQAEALVSFIQLENVDIEITQSQNKAKWWARFSMKDRPVTNYYIDLETKLINAAEKYNGKYGWIDILDPDKPMVEIV
jgi:uncharacterized protein (UPF0333 family)